MNNISQNIRHEGRTHDEKNVAKIPTKDIVCTGMFAAVLAILSQISVPIPTGVPVTMQTFAVALIGFILAWKLGAASTLIYILLGAVGVPVFTGFKGGAQVLVNYTGGFIWGFVIMVILCGIATTQTNKFIAALLSMAGLAVCHLFGVIQFMLVMNRGFMESFLLASAPYIIKDIISVVLAYIIGSQIRKRLLKAGLL
ncbi:MAG: biotin transporter BioY [Lachnospiraceae bacterium]|nr:biotin transporter BioY [Lachnospiraceae bacterium]